MLLAANLVLRPYPSPWVALFRHALSPCEIGYLTHITNAVSYDQVNDISLALTASTGMRVSVGRVIPQSYAFNTSNGLSVLVQNTGDLAVSLTNRYHEYVMLDDDDHRRPLDSWTPTPQPAR